jgi:hypothetical protein
MTLCSCWAMVCTNTSTQRLSKALRAVPHILKMSHHSSSDACVCYGLMVLPPAGAFHQDADMTFGDLRDRMINASRTQDSGNEALTVGCSSSRIARQLEETSCPEGESIYCWHRCMPIADYDVISISVPKSRSQRVARYACNVSIPVDRCTLKATLTTILTALIPRRTQRIIPRVGI